MAAMPKFTAQPLNRRVLESAGDLGVPRVQRPAPTKFEEFNLSQSNLSRSASRASLGSAASDSEGTRKAPFKARPFNNACSGVRSGTNSAEFRVVIQPTAAACRSEF